jgi:hypothetical protein
MGLLMKAWEVIVHVGLVALIYLVLLLTMMKFRLLCVFSVRFYYSRGWSIKTGGDALLIMVVRK